MSDVKLVINIDEEAYKKVLEINNRECEWNNMHDCYEAVLDGTPFTDPADTPVEAIPKANVHEAVQAVMKYEHEGFINISLAKLDEILKKCEVLKDESSQC